MSKIGRWFSEHRVTILTLIFCLFAFEILYLITIKIQLATGGASHIPSAENNALKNFNLKVLSAFGIIKENSSKLSRIKILKLDCEQEGNDHNFVDAELRIRFNPHEGVSRAYKWRNKIGKQKKANTWYLDEVIDAEGKVLVELIAIKIGSACPNQLLGSGEIDTSKDASKLQVAKLELGKYDLYWEKLE
jgi:hypothetical protein